MNLKLYLKSYFPGVLLTVRHHLHQLPAGPAGGDDLVLRRPGARRRIQPRLPPPAAKLLAAL